MDSFFDGHRASYLGYPLGHKHGRSMKKNHIASNHYANINEPPMKRTNAQEASPKSPLVSHISLARRVGALRIVLAIVVLLCLPMAFFTTVDPVGWRTIPSYVVPGLVVCIFWGLPFDILMSRIFLVGSDAPDYHLRHRSIVVLDLGMLTALLIFWGPFFVSILDR